MGKIIMLTFRGNAFYFVDNGFDICEVQNIADDISVIAKEKSEKEIYNLFVETVKEDLNIQLETVEISEVVRIHI